MSTKKLLMNAAVSFSGTGSLVVVSTRLIGVLRFLQFGKIFLIFFRVFRILFLETFKK